MVYICIRLVLWVAILTILYGESFEAELYERKDGDNKRRLVELPHLLNKYYGEQSPEDFRMSPKITKMPKVTKLKGPHRERKPTSLENDGGIEDSYNLGKVYERMDGVNKGRLVQLPHLLNKYYAEQSPEDFRMSPKITKMPKATKLKGTHRERKPTSLENDIGIEDSYNLGKVKKSKKPKENTKDFEDLIYLFQQLGKNRKFPENDNSKKTRSSDRFSQSIRGKGKKKRHHKKNSKVSVSKTHSSKKSFRKETGSSNNFPREPYVHKFLLDPSAFSIPNSVLERINEESTTTRKDRQGHFPKKATVTQRNVFSRKKDNERKNQSTVKLDLSELNRTEAYNELFKTVSKLLPAYYNSLKEIKLQLIVKPPKHSNASFVAEFMNVLKNFVNEVIPDAITGAKATALKNNDGTLIVFRISLYVKCLPGRHNINFPSPINSTLFRSRSDNIKPTKRYNTVINRSANAPVDISKINLTQLTHNFSGEDFKSVLLKLLENSTELHDQNRSTTLISISLPKKGLYEHMYSLVRTAKSVLCKLIPDLNSFVNWKFSPRNQTNNSRSEIQIFIQKENPQEDLNFLNLTHSYESRYRELSERIPLIVYELTKCQTTENSTINFNITMLVPTNTTDLSLKQIVRVISKMLREIVPHYRAYIQVQKVSLTDSLLLELNIILKPSKTIQVSDKSREKQISLQLEPESHSFHKVEKILPIILKEIQESSEPVSFIINISFPLGIKKDLITSEISQIITLLEDNIPTECGSIANIIFQITIVPTHSIRNTEIRTRKLSDYVSDERQSTTESIFSRENFVIQTNSTFSPAVMIESKVNMRPKLSEALKKFYSNMISMSKIFRAKKHDSRETSERKKFISPITTLSSYQTSPVTIFPVSKNRKKMRSIDVYENLPTEKIPKKLRFKKNDYDKIWKFSHSSNGRKVKNIQSRVISNQTPFNNRNIKKTNRKFMWPPENRINEHSFKNYQRKKNAQRYLQLFNNLNNGVNSFGTIRPSTLRSFEEEKSTLSSELVEKSKENSPVAHETLITESTEPLQNKYPSAISSSLFSQYSFKRKSITKPTKLRKRHFNYYNKRIKTPPKKEEMGINSNYFNSVSSFEYFNSTSSYFNTFAATSNPEVIPRSNALTRRKGAEEARAENTNYTLIKQTTTPKEYSEMTENGMEIRTTVPENEIFETSNAELSPRTISSTQNETQTQNFKSTFLENANYELTERTAATIQYSNNTEEETKIETTVPESLSTQNMSTSYESSVQRKTTEPLIQPTVFGEEVSELAYSTLSETAVNNLREQKNSTSPYYETTTFPVITKSEITEKVREASEAAVITESQWNEPKEEEAEYPFHLIRITSNRNEQVKRKTPSLISKLQSNQKLAAQQRNQLSVNAENMEESTTLPLHRIQQSNVFRSSTTKIGHTKPQLPNYPQNKERSYPIEQFAKNSIDNNLFLRSTNGEIVDKESSLQYYETANHFNLHKRTLNFSEVKFDMANKIEKLVLFELQTFSSNVIEPMILILKIRPPEELMVSELRNLTQSILSLLVSDLPTSEIDITTKAYDDEQGRITFIKMKITISDSVEEKTKSVDGSLDKNELEGNILFIKYLNTIIDKFLKQIEQNNYGQQIFRFNFTINNLEQDEVNFRYNFMNSLETILSQILPYENVTITTNNTKNNSTIISTLVNVMIAPSSNFQNVTITPLIHLDGLSVHELKSEISHSILKCLLQNQQSDQNISEIINFLFQTDKLTSVDIIQIESSIFRVFNKMGMNGKFLSMNANLELNKNGDIIIGMPFLITTTKSSLMTYLNRSYEMNNEEIRHILPLERVSDLILADK